MDTLPILPWTDNEIERRLLERAVAEARESAASSVPNDVACAEMLREIEDIDRLIAELMAREG
jgi:hypothetical protein